MMYCLSILTFVNWNYSTVAIGCEKNSHVFIVLFCLFVFVTSLTRFVKRDNDMCCDKCL